MLYTKLSLIIVAFFLFFSFVIVSIYNYRGRFKLDYHLRSHFPYEFNYHGKYNDNLYGNIIYALYFIVAEVFLVFAAGHDNGYLIFALISGSIAIISLSALLYVPIDHLKVHMLIAALAFIFSLGFSFSIVLASYYMYKDSGSISSLVSIIISILITAIYTILILNPKLNHLADMDTEKNEDGTLKQVRPKYFVLAYSEWAMKILFLFSLISLFIINI